MMPFLLCRNLSFGSVISDDFPSTQLRGQTGIQDRQQMNQEEAPSTVSFMRRRNSLITDLGLVDVQE